MTITLRRGRKCGDPNYGSTDVGVELTLECDDETYFDKPQEFAAWIAAQYAAADNLIESELRALYARRRLAEPGPVETASQRDERQAEPAGRSNGRSNGHTNGYHSDGDREIDRARSREEPRGGDGPVERPRYDWDRNRNPEGRGRDDRDRPRDDRRGGGGRNGGGYGPPKTGAQLFAWAKGIEENGAEGFVKALGGWCKKNDLPWRFNDLSGADVRDVYEAGQAMLEDQPAY